MIYNEEQETLHEPFARTLELIGGQGALPLLGLVERCIGIRRSGVLEAFPRGTLAHGMEAPRRMRGSSTMDPARRRRQAAYCQSNDVHSRCTDYLILTLTDACCRGQRLLLLPDLVGQRAHWSRHLGGCCVPMFSVTFPTGMRGMSRMTALHNVSSVESHSGRPFPTGGCWPCCCGHRR